MAFSIGLRREDISPFERRVALVPSDVKQLMDDGVHIHVERFPRRTFKDAEYAALGIPLVDTLESEDLILGIKEMPDGYFRHHKAYMFFSHTIKGQEYNMDMLAELIDKECTLLDYEMVTNEAGKRLIFFGRFAGIVGMIDSLWILGRRLEVQGHASPFRKIEPAHMYDDIFDAKDWISDVGKQIAQGTIPEFMAPMVVGITGEGNVAKGALEVLDLLPTVEVAPDDLAHFVKNNPSLTDKIVKVVFAPKDMVTHRDPTQPFDLAHYFENGHQYVSQFGPYLKQLTVLINGIYWEEVYPKLATAHQFKELYAANTPPKLIVVGDVTCDVDGSLACTVQDTGPSNPVYVYNPDTRKATFGFEGKGPCVLAVSNLPSELPKMASVTFSKALLPFIPQMAGADWTAPFDKVDLPDPIKRSVVLWRGKFTPKFEYMKSFLQLSRKYRSNDQWRKY